MGGGSRQSAGVVVAGALALAWLLVPPGSAGAHGGPGDAFANCLNTPSQAWVETYPPTGVRVLNRTARRDRQTVVYRAQLWYYRLRNRSYEWVAAEPGEEFYTRVAERRGKRRTTAYWARSLDGDVRRWGTSWGTAFDVNTYVEIELDFVKRGRVLHTDRYVVPSLNYTEAPYGNRYWTETCYRWNYGLTAKPYPSPPSTVYFREDGARAVRAERGAG